MPDLSDSLFPPAFDHEALVLAQCYRLARERARAARQAAQAAKQTTRPEMPTQSDAERAP